jgi:hypothetical protein
MPTTSVKSYPVTDYAGLFPPVAESGFQIKSAPRFEANQDRDRGNWSFANIPRQTISRAQMTQCPICVAARAAAVALLCAVLYAGSANSVRGQYGMVENGQAGSPYTALPVMSGTSPYPITGSAQAVSAGPAIYGPQPGMMMANPNTQLEPTSASMIVPGDGGTPCVDADVYCQGPPDSAYQGYPNGAVYPGGPMLASPSDVWDWQVIPQGLIYRSYWAGVKEPRLGIQLMHITGGHSFWDPTVGARIGLLRYGTTNGLRPEGWEWDVEGAAEPRLTLDTDRDLESVDFRAGTLITYGLDNWQFKFGYYHLSSHLGDELAIKDPVTLTERINYVRDSLILGASYYPNPIVRLYGETAWAFNPDGGAKPWEFQFGTELSEPGPTGANGTPFLALNGHLRQEEDFSGDFTAQTGWLWRGVNGQTMRVGFHYLNGKSPQYQTFSRSEQEVGVGLWYDF